MFGVCECVRAYVRAYVRECVRAYVRAYVRECVRARVRVLCLNGALMYVNLCDVRTNF